ncbi:glycosyltransferase [Nocardioides rubriscoriae]|uniref:glycosyltransferase n=1 Tax=Nocardioides rubriscoriae TaxID=642762 RepID=UPI001B8801F9|nr:glycosyltransferase [Nocardioides rubriscoriae]
MLMTGSESGQSTGDLTGGAGAANGRVARPRIAIAHDYLTQRGGAERVVLALSRIFPDAPIFTTLYEPDQTYDEFRGLDIRVSALNQVRLFRRDHRRALPFLAWAASSVHIDADLVIASSSGWSHGFRTQGRKVVYCYAPARWLYESDRYLGDSAGMSTRAALRVLSPALRRWDRRAASSADAYLAISSVTQGRIKRAYGFDVDVVPAPHTVDVALVPDDRRLPAPGYYLVVSRLLPYKNVREIVEAFRDRPTQRLVVIGAGPQKAELQQAAASNVIFLEGLTDAEMAGAYRGCRALVAASHEDFGLTPLEAAAHGKPSVVLRWGGFLDTVIEGSTGIFFNEPRPDLIAAALDECGSRTWDADVLRRRADDFSEQSFAARIRLCVDEMLQQAPPSVRREDSR